MLITEIVGNISDFQIGDREVDRVELAWWDVRKKIARLTSKAGRDIAIRLEKAPKTGFCDGDVIYADSSLLVLIHILPQDALCIVLSEPFEIARVCYEIGNLHSALFYGEEKGKALLRIPYEAPIQRLLDKLMMKYEVRQEVLDGSSRLQVSMPHSEPSANRVHLSGDFNVSVKRREE